jgi:hypothetical protein
MSIIFFITEYEGSSKVTNVLSYGRVWRMGLDIDGIRTGNEANFQGLNIQNTERSVFSDSIEGNPATYC